MRRLNLCFIIGLSCQRRYSIVKVLAQTIGYEFGGSAVTEIERAIIRERVSAGSEKAKMKGVKIGRP